MTPVSPDIDVYVTGESTTLDTDRLNIFDNSTLHIFDGGSVIVNLLANIDSEESSIVVDGSNSINPSRLILRSIGIKSSNLLSVGENAEVLSENILLESMGTLTASSPTSQVSSTHEFWTRGGIVDISGGAHLQTANTEIIKASDSPFTQEFEMKIQAASNSVLTSWSNSGDVIVGLGDDGGRLFIEGGHVEIDGTMTINQFGIVNLDPSITNGVKSELFVDQLRNEDGGELNLNGGTLAVNQYLGDLDNEAATLAPGLGEAGNSLLFGDYIQRDAASLSLDVGSTSDLLEVAGGFLAGGSLEIRLLPGFTPEPSNTYLVASAFNMIGSFDNIASGHRLNLANGNGSFQVNYGAISSYPPGQIVLSDFEAGNFILGDVNSDGNLDLLDVAPFVEAIVNGDFVLSADVNQDGALDLLDVQPFIELLIN